MDSHLLQILQFEVERQCGFVLMAAEDIRRALGCNDSGRVWYSVQALLVAAANVSKLLWPPGRDLRKRGETLRDSLLVGDDSPIRGRGLRDAFEHFDERIEKWAQSSPRGAFVDSNIGLAGRIEIDAKSEKDYLRNFEPATWTVTFWGDSYHLIPLVEAIRSLQQRAAIETRRPHRQQKHA